MGPIGYPELIVIGLIGLIMISIPFWIWMLVDCISNEPKDGREKMVWVIAIALTGAIGGLAYLMVRRPARKRQFGR